MKNPPVGLGEPVFDKLEADLAKALMSIGAIKGFEVGNGFEAAKLRGSQNNDAVYLDKKAKRVPTRTNRAGGIIGGFPTVRTSSCALLLSRPRRLSWNRRQ